MPVWSLHIAVGMQRAFSDGFHFPPLIPSWTFLLNITSVRSLAKLKVFTRALWGIVSRRSQAGWFEQTWVWVQVLYLPGAKMAGELAALHSHLLISDSNYSCACLSAPNAGVALHCPPSKRQYPHNMWKAIRNLPSSISDWLLHFQMPQPLCSCRTSHSNSCHRTFALPLLSLFPAFSWVHLFPVYRRLPVFHIPASRRTRVWLFASVSLSASPIVSFSFLEICAFKWNHIVEPTL